MGDNRINKINGQYYVNIIPEYAIYKIQQKCKHQNHKNQHIVLRKFFR